MKDNKMKFKIEGAAITALAIVAVILLNLIFSVLGEKVNLKLDLTGGGVFTLSDESKAVVEGADKEVDIYYATNAQNRNTRYSEILETFGRANDLISVKEVNLDTDPGFSRTYKIKSYNSVVVECKATSKVRIVDSSLIEYNGQNDNGVINTKVNYLESYVSAAIRYVTSEKPLMVYIAMGHGEIIENSSFLDYLMDMLYSEAMSVKLLDFTTDAVPADADMILFAGPTADFTDADIKKLDDYLEAGGRVQFYSNPSYSLSNLNTYFSNNWGAYINNDCVSDSNSAFIAASAMGNYLIPYLKEHAITSYLMSVSSKLRVQEGEVNSINIAEKSDIEANVIVATSDTGVSMDRENWVKKNAREPYNVSEPSEKNIMVYLRKNSLNNSETTSRLLLSGTYYLLFDRFIDSSSSYADKDLVVKTINYMSGIEDAPVSVSSKSIVHEKMEVLEKSKLVYCVVFLTGVIPAILFGYGIYVYLRRRRL